MKYIAIQKKRCLICQFVGLTIVLFVMFIRDTSFGRFDYTKSTLHEIRMGTWPLGLDALFNGTAHFLFIIGVSMIFLPIFLGKLTVLRDIYAA
jgi:hypothetical protein